MLWNITPKEKMVVIARVTVSIDKLLQGSAQREQACSAEQKLFVFVVRCPR